MKSQLHRDWPVVVVVCLGLGLAIATTAVSVGHATGSAGTDQSVSNSEKVKPTKADDGNKMSAVQSTAGTVKVTESSFDDQVLKSDVPVLVDFYAEWCGPCHVQAPILDELAREIETAKIVKVDVDENRGFSSKSTLTKTEGWPRDTRLVRFQPCWSSRTAKWSLGTRVWPARSN